MWTMTFRRFVMSRARQMWNWPGSDSASCAGVAENPGRGFAYPGIPESGNLRRVLRHRLLVRLEPLVLFQLVLPLPFGAQLPDRPLEILHRLGPLRGVLEVLPDGREPVG